MASENRLDFPDNVTTTSSSPRVSNENENDTLENESRWWQIENDDFILDQVPNVTSEFVRQPQPRTDSESEINENFERLHKIADKIKLTLSEHAKNNSEKPEDSETLETSLAEVHTYHEQSLDEFKEELRVRRLARQSAVQELRDEITSLRRQLATERALSQRLRSGEDLQEVNVLPQKNDCERTILNVMSSQKTSTREETKDNSNDDADDEDPLSRSRHANIELANAQLALQMSNSENISLRGELSVLQKQVGTLKEVITCCKQMLTIKEEQCNDLKQKLNEIEKSFAEHEMKLMSDNLRQEYERQLTNIRQLRQLYEERQRISAAEYENLQRLISIKRDELSNEQEKTKKLEEGNQKLVNDLENVNNELQCLRDECKEHKFEKATLKEEIGAVNMLFSQMVLGFNGKNNLDIDRLTAMLEENRALLNELAVKELNCSDDATLPKLLFELVEQASVSNDNNQQNNNSCRNSNSTTPEVEDVNIDWNNISNTNDNATLLCTDGNDGNYAQDQQQQQLVSECGQGAIALPKHCTDEKIIVSANVAAANTGKTGKKLHRKNSNNKKATSTATTQSSTTVLLNLHDSPNLVSKFATVEEIIDNLPKVWRVLMELLSHHQTEQVQFDENGKGEDCYKSAETSNSCKGELSVSKTYLKLKDLILEKKSLVKETNRLKTLNSHLECRLNEQEKRLGTVSLELTKTWHLVGKMQRQHRQLHTQEQILRYQLQQKRRLLSELKDELEYCRRKWAAARAKNDESQEQCNDLRREFAKRKLEDSNNSAESGYSDSCGPASEEEDHERLPLIDNSGDILEVAGACSTYRRKRLREMFEHTRKIKRMQSNSPGRAASNVSSDRVVVLRWNSAPPTCGWRGSGYCGDEIDNDDEENVTLDLPPTLLTIPSAVLSNELDTTPTGLDRTSRSSQRRSAEKQAVNAKVNDKVMGLDDEPQEERAVRIKRLEEQCKSLIKQVLETSDNRERLEMQLRHFQDEMAPVKCSVPLKDANIKKRFERMTRASSAPITGCLTPREEEYTRKRSERLGRLEEESRQLISRIRRTADRGNYLRCSLERLRRMPSPEGSFESNTEEEHEAKKVEEKSSNVEKSPEDLRIDSTSDSKCFTSNCMTKQSPDQQDCEERIEVHIPNATADTTDSVAKSCLTEEEEAYTARRSARLQRLEDESKQLLDKLSRNTQRGDNLGNRLDTLHQRYGNSEAEIAENIELAPPLPEQQDSSSLLTVEERIDKIEKISINREERLRILEEEGRKLINRLSETSERGTKMIDRIAARESNRQKCPSSNKDNEKAGTSNSSLVEDNPTTVTMWPTPKNVACSSIVSEELTERVTITTIPSQMVASKGAIPKSKPTAQLYAALPKSARIQREKKEPEESLEDMIKRLQSLPFPSQNSDMAESEKSEGEVKGENENAENKK
ncbi:intracellular protein transport protein USO1 [Glossina fuscipes]|uniref:Intracellular protein transport protein USO1 n=1 Tax=Glossina fuscipes TaxID=7396 RepID=A0A8U0W9U8_9MUSC|nr:intracellular protein transport protein USO1 [Glossina fuscipes]KAI9586012.1 hypothetical protein GQX74_001859 [Glossina fuscipes]